MAAKRVVSEGAATAVVASAAAVRWEEAVAMVALAVVVATDE